MVKRIGTDWGLNVRMVLTMFLLACLYLAFMGALYYFGVNAFLIVFIAGILLIAQYYFSDKLILLSLGAREVSEQEAPQLHDMVGRLSAMTGIPKPKVAIIESNVPNALATGRDPKHSVVAVTTGILETLDAEEMEAVLAHELSHVIHRDMRVMAMASFFATVASFIVQMGFWAVEEMQKKGIAAPLYVRRWVITSTSTGRCSFVTMLTARSSTPLRASGSSTGPKPSTPNSVTLWNFSIGK